MRMLRPLLVRSVLGGALVLAVAGFFLHHSACVAHERPLTRIPMENLINPELGSGLPSAEEIEASEPAASPALTR
jgi:hypothetical protein